MSNVRQIAIGGVFAALSFVFMYMSTLMPLPYFWVFASGFVIMAIVVEVGRKTAFFAYLAVSFLCLMMLPNVSRILIFVILIGHYPILKDMLDKISYNIRRRAVKLILFFVIGAIQVFFTVQVLGMPLTFGQFQIEQGGLLVALAIIYPIVSAILYDYVVGSMKNYYITRLRPRIRNQN